MRSRFVILDRDGVINRDSDAFIKSPDEWQPIKGSIDAIANLHRAGFGIAVASNQSGVGRGLLDIDTLTLIHEKMHALVDAAGGRIDHVVFCPHLPGAGCDCRKPLPGLLAQIGEHCGISLNTVSLIGDSLRDLQAAVAVGAEPLLVRTGNGGATEDKLSEAGIEAMVFDDLRTASEWLISRATPKC